MGAISVMAERESVIDFTVPYYDLVRVAITIHYVSTILTIYTIIYNIYTIYVLGWHHDPDEEGYCTDQPVQVPLGAGDLGLGLHPRRILRHLRPAVGLRQVVALQLPEQHEDVRGMVWRCHLVYQYLLTIRCRMMMSRDTST